MRLLLVKNRLPWPLRSGQDLVDFSLIKALEKKHEITLIAPGSSTGEIEAALPGLGKYCQDVRPVLVPPKSGLREKIPFRIGREANFWLKFIPLEATDFLSALLWKEIESASREKKFDFAELAFWTMGSYLPAIRQACPKFLLEHDSAYLFYKRQKLSRHKKRLGVRMREWYAEKTALMNYEKQVCRSFDQVLFISPADLTNLQDEFGIREKAGVVPIPFDIPAEPVGGMDGSPGKILFLGGMQTPYNIDSMSHYRHDILPIVQAEIPNIELSIVGNPPPDPMAAAELADPSIRYIGFQADLTETFRRYQVLIAPVWIGTGIKTKIMEGLARGMPIVTTPIGIEGIDVIPGNDLLVAKDNADFARQLIRILKDDMLRQKIGANGFETFKNKLGFDAVSSRTLSSYEDAYQRCRDKYHLNA